MSFSMQFGGRDFSRFGKNWGKFFVLGIALVILGALALCYSTFTTLLSVMVLGFFVFVAGVFVLIDSFVSWWGKWSAFFLHFLMGVLYVVAGYMLINSPVWSSLSITMLLAMLYIMLGVFRIVYSLSLRMPHWGWTFFNGLIALLLGTLILAQWPYSGLFIIGLFIGIDLLFSGWNCIMASLAARRISRGL